MTSEADWTRQGARAILDLINAEFAVVGIEIDARIAEKQGTSHHIQPHVLQRSQQLLRKRGEIVSTTALTRGGKREITTWSLNVPGISKKSLASAQSRKRLLLARYLQWANGVPGQGKHTGIVGSSLEQIVHASIRESAPSMGYLLQNPLSGHVRQLFGLNLDAIGSLDNGFKWYDFETNQTFQIVVEAKNLRDWIYPHSKELFQLLHKAAFVSAAAAAAGEQILPVLVCRRASPTLFAMAKDLGFFVIETRHHLISFNAEKEEEKEQINQVRFGLGLSDVLDHSGPYELITKRFSGALPQYARSSAGLWMSTNVALGRHYEVLRRSVNARNYKVLRDAAIAFGINPRSW